MGDHAKNVEAGQKVTELINLMKNAQKAGGFDQETTLEIVEKWIELGMAFEKGGDPKREGANYFKFAKQFLLQDYLADPKATPPVQSYEDIGHAPKASKVFYEKLNMLANFCLSDNMIQRGYAFNDTEGAFLVMLATYRIKLAADRKEELKFRHAIGRLKHKQTLP
ncbi:MAG TPA: hypothetical protein VGF59_03615 [Bryobacteraceae bacterium]|jgi:hypothetical protein